MGIHKLVTSRFAADYLEWIVGMIPWLIVAAFASIALGTHTSLPHFLIDHREPESWREALKLNLQIWFPSAFAAWLLSHAASRWKFNPEHPPSSLVIVEAMRSVGGIVIATALELSLIQWCVPDDKGPVEATWSTLMASFTGWQLILQLWLDFHFYCVHRLQHEVPWLYRHVHKVHHQSYNPDPFSGHSMHPVEQLLFFSSFALCLPLRMPYYILRVMKIYVLLGPLAEHLGALTGHRHYLHHEYFSFNYGSSLLFDVLFETSLEDLPQKKRDRILAGMAKQQAELAGTTLKTKGG